MQNHYSSVRTAWKVWDSAIILSRWFHANSEILTGKKVLEVGSGCGLVGLLASLYSKETTLTDYLPEIVEVLKTNTKLNYPHGGADHILSCVLDWEKVVVDSSKETEAKRYDIIFGSDLVYNLQHAEWLPVVIDKLLVHSSTSRFITILPKNRLGVDEFRANLSIKGFEEELSCNPPEQLFIDLSKKCHWSLIVAKRKDNSALAHDVQKTEQLREDRKSSDDWLDFRHFVVFEDYSKSDSEEEQ